MSRQAYMSLVCTSIRSAGAIGPACSTAMTCRACRGPTTSSKAASAIPVAACCGPRARRASPSARCNAKVPGSSYPGPQQRPSYWGPCVTLHLRTWLRKGSALLRIANGSACRADPFDRPKRNSITCVRGGRRDSLQAQGDFRGIATQQITRFEEWLWRLTQYELGDCAFFDPNGYTFNLTQLPDGIHSDGIALGQYRLITHKN